MSSILENINHLKDIISKYELEDITEAMEFLEAVENDADDLNDTITKQKKEITELENEESDPDEAKFDNSDFVGLDTINWSLEKGNLNIQMKMERFLEALKSQNCVGTNAF